MQMPRLVGGCLGIIASLSLLACTELHPTEDLPSATAKPAVRVGMRAGCYRIGDTNEYIEKWDQMVMLVENGIETTLPLPLRRAKDGSRVFDLRKNHEGIVRRADSGDLEYELRVRGRSAPVLTDGPGQSPVRKISNPLTWRSGKCSRRPLQMRDKVRLREKFRAAADTVIRQCFLQHRADHPQINGHRFLVSGDATVLRNGNARAQLSVKRSDSNEAIPGANSLKACLYRGLKNEVQFGPAINDVELATFSWGSYTVPPD